MTRVSKGLRKEDVEPLTKEHAKEHVEDVEPLNMEHAAPKSKGLCSKEDVESLNKEHTDDLIKDLVEPTNWDPLEPSLCESRNSS